MNTEESFANYEQSVFEYALKRVFSNIVKVEDVSDLPVYMRPVLINGDEHYC